MPSQAIRFFAYDAGRHELTVTFARGRTVVYSLVPQAVATAFGDSGRKGAFHNTHIRGRYPFRRAAMVPADGARQSLREALLASAEEGGEAGFGLAGRKR